MVEMIEEEFESEMEEAESEDEEEIDGLSTTSKALSFREKLEHLQKSIIRDSAKKVPPEYANLFGVEERFEADSSFKASKTTQRSKVTKVTTRKYYRQGTLQDLQSSNDDIRKDVEAALSNDNTSDFGS